MDERGRLEILKEIEKAYIRIKKAQDSIALTEINRNKYIEEHKKIVENLGKELKQVNSNRLKEYASQESSLSSLSSIYSGITELERKRITLMSNLTMGEQRRLGISDVHEKAMGRIFEINRDLANLNREDIVGIASLNEEYEEQLSILQGVKGEGKEIVKLLEAQHNIARNFSKTTKDQKEFLEKQHAVLDGIKQTIGGVLETARTLLSNWKAAVGGVFIGMGFVVDKIGDMNKELGYSILNMNQFVASAGLLSFVFDDAKSTAQTLAAEFGSVEKATFRTQLNTNLIAKTTGISGDEAAKLTAHFARLNDGSTAIAHDLMVSTREFAKQRGVIPSAVMRDLANNTEAFALWGKEGGKNLIEAATYAAQLGTTMDKLVGTAESLLDFESSITKELELGALLGRNINLNQARSLAYAEDFTGMQEEILKQLGGIDEFNRMDIFAKKATADLLNISVAELNKMMVNQEKIGEQSSFIADRFNAIKEGATAFANTMGGQTLKALGSGLVVLGQMNRGMEAIKKMKILQIAKEKILLGWQKLRNLFLAKEVALEKTKATTQAATNKMIMAKSGKMYAADSPQGKMIANMARKTPTTTETLGTTSPMNKITDPKAGFNATNMIKGAAAILILAAALFVAAKAFQQFSEVEWEDVGKGVVGLTAMAGVAFLLGQVQGEMIKGAAAVAILGVALIPFAYAMSLIADVDIKSVLSVAAGLVIFSAAIFGLGALMTTGVGAFVFGAGLVALVGLGMAMAILGAGLLVSARGFEAIGNSLESITSTIANVGEVIGGLIKYIAPIGALSLALVGLSGALTMLGMAGLVAAPGLMALSMVGAIATGLGSLLGGGGETKEERDNKELLNEIRGLRNDLNAGKVAVYLDGKKVTSGISNVVDRIAVNSYSF